MFFHEFEAIADEYPDLHRTVEKLDDRLSGICSPAPLRIGDLSCVLDADVNQVASVFDLLEQQGVVYARSMVECDWCQTLMPAEDFLEAVEDEDAFECSGCDRVYSPSTTPMHVYRLTPHALERTIANTKQRAVEVDTPSCDDPLNERAQEVLQAMLELGAVDSDQRKPTETIAIKAIGQCADANSLKVVMSELKTRKLINSKTGRGGGCWLTANGRQRAEKLRSGNRNSATV